MGVKNGRGPTTDDPAGVRPRGDDGPIYSIRFLRGPGPLCTACDARDTGAGPVAHCDREAICDICALESGIELGLVLALVALIRVYATTSEKTGTDSLEALRDLGAFARIYELVAAKTGPPRIPRFPGQHQRRCRRQIKMPEPSPYREAGP